MYIKQPRFNLKLYALFYFTWYDSHNDSAWYDSHIDSSWYDSHKDIKCWRHSQTCVTFTTNARQGAMIVLVRRYCTL